VVYNGNEGTRYEYSVDRAAYYLDEAQTYLGGCEMDRIPESWSICEDAKDFLDEADKILVQVLTNAVRRNCWLCDPGKEDRPGTLVAVAARMAGLTDDYKRRSGNRDVRFERTYDNIVEWLAEPPCPQARPRSREVCDDDVDNDGDGDVDCFDSDCDSDRFCQPGFRERNCNDGIDNDRNGFTDCEDVSCSTSPHCRDDPPTWHRVDTIIGRGQSHHSNRDPGDSDWGEYWYGASSSTVQVRVKVFSDGEVAKDWFFKWWLKPTPPPRIDAGETVEMTLHGIATQHRGPANDGRVSTAHVESDELGFKERVKLSVHRQEDFEKIKFRLSDSAPRRFVIHFGKTGKAASVKYVYERE